MITEEKKRQLEKVNEGEKKKGEMMKEQQRRRKEGREG